MEMHWEESLIKMKMGNTEWEVKGKRLYDKNPGSGATSFSKTK
jgi:hypothetical protein